jgi:thiol-disulfide isomerase/thioredoxin
MNEGDTHLDDLIREHYESRRPRPGRLAALEESLLAPQRKPRQRRLRLTQRTAVLHAACVTLSAAAGAVLGGFEPAPEREPAADIIAVQFYADWCSPSQVVAKRVEALQEAAADKSVLFVRLDLTDDTRREQAQLLMSSLGCGSIWDTQRGRTGALVLIDAHAMRSVSKLDQDDDAEQMIVALSQALAQAAAP